MADEIRIEHTLGWPERRLLERLVRVAEVWARVQVTQVPPELRAAIEAMVTEAEQVAKQMRLETEYQMQQEPKQPEPHQGA